VSEVRQEQGEEAWVSDRARCGRNVDTSEATKPSYFYEGFVLYGAAPGVEYAAILLIMM